MKKLLFLFLLFGYTLNAQTLYKDVVDATSGEVVRVELTAEEYAQHVLDSANTALKLYNDSVEQTRINGIRSTLLSTAQSAVGIRVDQLTAAQVRALAAILFHKEGAIDTALKIKPLTQWVR